MRTVLLVSFLLFLIVAQNVAQSGNDLFQEALVRQTANSDVRGAIQILERIVREFRSDRPLVARALLQLGKCYESLKDPRARDYYEQVVRDYADQTALVAEARDRMRANPTATTQITTITSDPYGFAVSPDGKSIVFSVLEGTRGRLWLHDVATNKATPIEGVELNRRLSFYGFPTGRPFWSPDSKTIGFFNNGKLWRIPARGGAPRALADTVNPDGGTWSQDGTIVFGNSGELSRVAADGGKAVSLGIKGTCPAFLPNGRDFLYYQINETIARGQAAQVLLIGSLNSTTSKLLPVQAYAGVFAAPDQLLFATGQGLFAQRMNMDTLELTGSPSRVGEPVAVRTAWCEMAVSTSASGLLAYRTSFSTPERQLVWLNRLGQRIGEFVPDSSSPCCARISPDGRRVIFGREGGGAPAGSVWLVEDVPGAEAKRVVAGAKQGVWSPLPDIVMLALFRARPPGGPRLSFYSLAALSGTTLRDTPLEWPTDWSKDGKYVLFESEANLMVLPMEGAPESVREPIPFAQTEAIETAGRFSPNGKWVAYQSSTGPGVQSEIFVQPFSPDSNSSARRISLGSGSAPRWRGDNGRELYFVSPDLGLMRVTVNYVGDEKIELGKATRLFTLPDPDYDVFPDGQRFLVSQITRPAVAGPLIIKPDGAKTNQ